MTSTRTVPGPVLREPDTGVPLALVGPTASGKTEASIELARRLDAEVLIVDSMTVYRGMNIGTAKPGRAERDSIPHHLIDIAEPSEPFSVATFQRLAGEAVADVRDRGKTPLLVGGSGLYFRAVVDELEFPGTDPALRGSLQAEASAIGAEALHARLTELDPVAAAKMEPTNERRVVRALEVLALTGRPFSSYAEAWDRYPEGRVRAAGIRVQPDVLRARIEQRARVQLEGGLIAETGRLLQSGAEPLLTASQAIGYAEAAEHLAGGITLDEAFEKIVRRTKALARRQLAWFKRDPRIRWFEADSAIEAVDDMEEHFRT
ncbi:MAG: tRNA (adenosine(37)-N6)-dimethylallyltransferase MiaA [Actinomycetota bacterium]